MYVPLFYGLTTLCGLLFYYTKSKVETSEDANFKSFQKTYLSVYLLAVAGDWLQGPHVYALYDSYGMTKHQIEILFIAGFGSSLLFGTVIGSFADKFGRRNNCLLYALLYGGACITKHFNDINVLMIGRFLGGIATSILYSAFESWLVYEHNKRGLSDQLLGTIFSHAALGNSLVAIISGISAQFVADQFGYVAPFDLALLVLGVMFVLVYGTWSENYGNETAAVQQSFKEAAQTIRDDVRVLCLGLVQSLFEGAMYTFVLEWTPALTQASAEGEHSIPHGYIFASFMVATMMGSSVFKIVSKKSRPEDFMRYVLVVAAICLSVPIFMPTSAISIFIAFIIFEGCVGMFWPAMGYLRGVYLPEETRSTTINLFRVPLNLIVIFILLQNFSMLAIFDFCVFFLLLAACAQHVLYSHTLAEVKGLPIKGDDQL